MMGTTVCEPEEPWRLRDIFFYMGYGMMKPCMYKEPFLYPLFLIVGFPIIFCLLIHAMINPEDF